MRNKKKLLEGKLSNIFSPPLSSWEMEWLILSFYGNLRGGGEEVGPPANISYLGSACFMLAWNCWNALSNEGEREFYSLLFIPFN